MEEQRERMERVKRQKTQGLQDRYLYDYTFANDNGQNPVMEKAHAYVRQASGNVPSYDSNKNTLIIELALHQQPNPL